MHPLRPLKALVEGKIWSHDADKISSLRGLEIHVCQEKLRNSQKLIYHYVEVASVKVPPADF